MRFILAFFVALLISLSAYGQRTGGSFGGSRWGSGSPSYSRPSTPSYSRPSTPSYSRPSTPSYSRPSIFSRPAPFRPVVVVSRPATVVHTSTPIFIPVHHDTHHWWSSSDDHVEHHDSYVAVDHSSTGWVGALVLVIVFAVIAAIFIAMVRAHRD